MTSPVEQDGPNKPEPEQDGTVIEAMPNEMYSVELENGIRIVAHIAPQMRMKHTRVRPGERVRVQITTYDHSRGRITQRLV